MAQELRAAEPWVYPAMSLRPGNNWMVEGCLECVLSQLRTDITEMPIQAYSNYWRGWLCL